MGTVIWLALAVFAALVVVAIVIQKRENAREKREAAKGAAIDAYYCNLDGNYRPGRTLR